MSRAQLEMIDYAERLLRSATVRRGRLSRDVRDRLLHSSIPDTLAERARSREEYERAMRFRRALEIGNRNSALDELRQIQRWTGNEANERVVELETEVSHLRGLLAAEQSRPKALAEGGDLEDETEEENLVEAFERAKHRVFVIMPFDHDFDDVWKGAIKRACKDLKIAGLRVDEVHLSSGIDKDIKKFVGKSATIIADITGNNANVMYELGYALGKGKNPIIICQAQEASKIPFDISSIRHLQYVDSWQGIEDLYRELKKYLTETINSKGKRKTGKSVKTKG